MKDCRKCGERKPLDSFPPLPSSRDGRGYYCRSCARMMTWASQVKKRYGVTLEQVAEILRAQCEACAICSQPISFGGKGTSNGQDSTSAHIDHCHLTNRVRGILCPACNHGLGKFRDDSILLHRAARYLDGKGCEVPKN